MLSLPDNSKVEGRRDLAILTLLYDSGARVQEIVDLSFGDVRNVKPATVTLTGKENKSRIVPIMPQSISVINDTFIEGNCEADQKPGGWSTS